MIRKKCCLLLCVLTVVLSVWAERKGNSCPMVRIVPERLPDLTVPRSGHNIFYVNGELTVVGGHTTHFVPSPTAEYFDGELWHQMPMAYSHDNGFAVVLRSGEVIIGGGHEEPLGIGQTFMVERYTPATHTFEGFGCLDRRRTLASGTQLADGRVIIAGNHFADDAIGCYDGRSQIQHIGNVTQGRNNPYILHTAPDDAIILGSRNTHTDIHDTVWADHVKGGAFRVPLLEQWTLVYTDQPFNSDICSIDDYSYLLAATDERGQLGIVMMRDTCFSLLPTVCPIPMQSRWGTIFYKGPVVTDKKRQRGYIMGVDNAFRRQYLLSVDYSQKPAALTLYYTDSLENSTITIPVVTPDGDLLMVGGIPGSNYKPLSAVWCYHFGTTEQASAAGWPAWLWGAFAVMAVVALAYLIIYVRRKPSHTQAADADNAAPVDNKTMELIERVCQLMENERLYLRNDLKLQDVAVRLGTNSTYISECINNGRGQSFSQFVNAYRVRHAQKLLSLQPDKKTAQVANESGFSTEASFFRNFKVVTGMTPREWLATIA